MGADGRRERTASRSSPRAERAVQREAGGGHRVNPIVTRDFEVFKPASVYATGAIDLFAAARLSREAQNPARPARIPPILGDFKFLLTKRVSAPQRDYQPSLAFLTAPNPDECILLTV